MDADATTMTRALTDAERVSLERAAQAYNRGDINQREIGPGVWVLVPNSED